MKPPLTTLPIIGIVIAQLLGCSLWFSVNAVGPGLASDWGVAIPEMGMLTSAVQLGFISGTLGLALTGLADVFRASRIVLVAAVLGAMFNLGFVYVANDLVSGAVFRFCIGLCLAGIYPLGMKLIVSWSARPPGLGLGLLVGMLTLGTALPQAMAGLAASWPWQAVLAWVSAFAAAAGILVYWIGEGPYGAPAGSRLSLGAIFKAFHIRGFRGAALGYFGHMWELYAFWTLVPWLVAAVLAADATPVNIAWWSFAVIGIGSFGAIWAGWMSQSHGSDRIAFISLLLSGLVCVVYPFIAELSNWIPLLALLVWGFFVVADSAQFSALSAKACPPESVGSALAMQNSVGFALSVGSILLLTHLAETGTVSVVWWLVPGPVLGLLAMRTYVFSR